MLCNNYQDVKQITVVRLEKLVENTEKYIRDSIRNSCCQVEDILTVLLIGLPNLINRFVTYFS